MQIGWQWWTPTLEGNPGCRDAYPTTPWNCGIANYNLQHIQTNTFSYSAFSGKISKYITIIDDNINKIPMELLLKGVTHLLNHPNK
jgi:hypothetical protein